ncbi:hypothetical protein [Streptomyces alfalfae]|uniref:Uncharacterized protein n=1 Tax=Streptomyces alfalfae TaxID=1642299 RepID=A0A7T4TW79_9ACTN|nr:hypothetical protein [Streptomyces alfalfae]QQC87904.1 hypothetical protein I8755_05410 [Streptomyces alfalfae]
MESCRPALYWLWAALPLPATAWTLARDHQKHLQRRERHRHISHPTDWTPAA